MKKSFVFIGSGFELVGMVLGALFLGEKLDQFFGKKGVFVAVCLILFMAAWTFHFIFLLRKFMKDIESNDEENP